MTLARYAASAPTDALPLHCLELSHPDWPAVLRRVAQPDDWEVTLETAEVVTFPGWLTESEDDEASGQWEGAWPTMDDGGIVTRSLKLGDVERKLMALIESVRDSDEAVVCIYRFYTSNDLAVPKMVHRYQIGGECSYAGGVVSLSARTLDMGNMRWPRAHHTDANTPGWRGRW